MVAYMKTTLNIATPLLQRTKALARAAGTTPASTNYIAVP